jgi:hypothetical protein
MTQTIIREGHDPPTTGNYFAQYVGTCDMYIVTAIHSDENDEYLSLAREYRIPLHKYSKTLNYTHTYLDVSRISLETTTRGITRPRRSTSIDTVGPSTSTQQVSSWNTTV